MNLRDMSMWELQQTLIAIVAEMNRRQMDDIEMLGAMIHRFSNRHSEPESQTPNNGERE